MSGYWTDSDLHPTALLLDHAEHPRMRDATAKARTLLHDWCVCRSATPGRPRLTTLSLCKDDWCDLEEHTDSDPCLHDFRVWRYEPKHRCGT